MPYIINFTDRENKTPITVFDNTSNQDTSLTFPGRNVTGYGQIIAENFLSILENFANANSPINPIEGQLWYDTTNGVLQLWDNTAWKAASNIQKGPVEPSVETSKVGELWVDTTNQQLRIYTGTRWLLVGPQESSLDGLRYGPAVENISDTNNVTRSILIFYIADVPVIIVSKDSFVPKILISGFENIQSGINIATPANASQEAEFANIFVGGNLPKLIGTAKSAENLVVNDVDVPASRFLRSDVINTTEQGFIIRNNSGLTVGNDGNFVFSTSTTAGRIYNSSVGSNIDIQTNRNGIPTTIIRVIDNRVGINNLSPDAELDVTGAADISGNLAVGSNEVSTNLGNGSIKTNGGMSISKNLIIGTTIQVNGTSNLSNVIPRTTESFDLGSTSNRWQNVYAKSIVADEIVGTIDGNITGNANTATNLKNVTTFRLSGDVASNTISFDGQVGSLTKVFNTELTANIISGRDQPDPNRGEKTDFILTFRQSAAADASGGLLKQTRDSFIADLGIPIGAILPFAGSNVPEGFLLCDGSEVERQKYPDLYDIISTTYNGSVALVGTNTFRLPDLRGRFPLGRHNMDNGEQVPEAASLTGNYVDGGGGNPTPTRVEGTEATTLGASSGQNSVSLTLGNLPEHSHNLQNSGVQYSAIRLDTAVDTPPNSGAGPVGAGGVSAQYFNESGGIKKPSADFSLGTAVPVMNPFLTINYIIRSGPPEFETIIP